MDMVAIGTVVVAAMAAGSGSRLRAHEEPGYRWMKWWAPRQHRVTVLIVTAAHMLVGGLAAWAALRLGWHPVDESLWGFNALIYATGGEALFRADWSGFFLDAATPANSLLTALLRGLHSRLRDTVVNDQIPHYVSMLRETDLLLLVTEVVVSPLGGAEDVTLRSLRLNEELIAAGAVLESTASPSPSDRRIAFVSLKRTAEKEIVTTQYVSPRFENITKALADLTPRAGTAELRSQPSF